MAMGRIIGLLGMATLAAYTLYVMMPYLTHTWGLSITHAAGILNVFWGLSYMMPLLWKFLNDTVMRKFWVLLISSICFSAGLGLLWMSSPPVLANATGKCSEYAPECIGREQQTLFYMALALIALGISGHTASGISFVNEQVMGQIEDMLSGVNEADKCCNFLRRLWNQKGANVLTYVAVFAIPYIKPWSITFGILALYALVATLLFLSGYWSYRHTTRPNGSILTTFARVFVAALSKMRYRSPTNSRELYELPDRHYLPHTRSLRCLDKAAIILPTLVPQQQQTNRWRLCRATEVEETKVIIRAIPVLMTFIFCGVISSVVFIYFVAQLDTLNPKLGHLKLPIVLLLFFYGMATQIGPFFYMLRFFCKSGPITAITISMIISILGCITAAKVENRRLGVVQSHGLVDKPDERVPMTMFWMMPQFILLGLFDGIFEFSAKAFFADRFPVSTRKYLSSFISGVKGLGFLGSILCVFVVGRVSERGGKMSWFQDNVNGSRLDKYYWTLSWLMAINLVFFIVVGMLYQHMEPIKEGEEEEMNGINWEVNLSCCCCWLRGSSSSPIFD